MKDLVKLTLAFVCCLSMSIANAQEAATTVSPNPPLPATQGDKVAKQGDTKQAPAKKKTSSRSKTKTAETVPAPDKTVTDKAPAPANTGAGDSETKKESSGGAPAPKTRMAISEQGVPAEKPKTTAPTTSPK